jgi:hypothetical protein
MSSIPIPGGSMFRPDGHLPPDNFVEGWTQLGKKRWVAGKHLDEYIGRQAAMFQSYGVSLLTAADYKREGENESSLTIESYEMDNPLGASGIYHYHRGRILRGQGIPVDVGIEGVRGAGVLYFYKGLYFFKLIYTGSSDKKPNMVEMGIYIAKSIPGTSRPPRGFEYLAVDGVNPKTSRITAGYTFNYDFLPTGIFCKAPGAGKIAEVFILGHYDKGSADRTARDYRFFLEKYGLDYSFKRNGLRRLVWWARDPTHGRVICTQYGTWIVGVLTPETYEKGELIIDRVIERMKER